MSGGLFDQPTAWRNGEIIERDGRRFRVEFDADDPVERILGPRLIPIDPPKPKAFEFNAPRRRKV